MQGFRQNDCTDDACDDLQKRHSENDNTLSMPVVAVGNAGIGSEAMRAESAAEQHDFNYGKTLGESGADKDCRRWEPA